MSDEFSTPDPEVLDRMRDSHEKYLRSLDPNDRTSIVYGSPILAEKYRAKAQEDFEDILGRHGVILPEPKDAAEERFEAGWNAPLHDDMAALIDREFERATALAPAERAHRAAELKRELGDDRFRELVKQARSAVEPADWDDAILTNKFLLTNIAARGRYLAGYERARAAFDQSRANRQR